MERCVLVLRALLNLAVKLGSGSLIDSCLLLETHDVYCLEDTENADSVNFACVLGSFEAYAYVRLSCEVIDLIGLDVLNCS